MWAGPDDAAGADRAGPGSSWRPASCSPRRPAGARLDGVTAVLLLTGEDDFNALASTLLEDACDGPVYRLAPPTAAMACVAAPYTGGAAALPRGQRSTVDRGTRTAWS